MKPMKPRERLLAAINHEEPDRVPVHPRFNDMTFLKEFGGLSRQQLPGTDASSDIGWGASGMAEWRMKVYEWLGVDDLIIPTTFDPLPKEKTPWKPYEKRERIIASYPDYELRLTEIITPSGTLRGVTRLGHYDADKVVEYMIKDLEEDIDKLRYYFSIDHDKRTVNMAKRAKERLGDNGILEGHIGYDLNMDYQYRFKVMHLQPDLYEEYVKMGHESQMFATRVFLEKAEPDTITGGGGFDLQLMREELYDRFVDPYIRELYRLILEHGAYPNWHQDGPGVKYLEKIRDTGTKILECMDMPPLGDIYMAEAKKRIGDDVCFLGNVDLMTIFQGTPKEVEALIKYVVEEGAPGGGLIASTGDSPPYGTPLINVQTLVKTAKKFGRYPIRRT